jgi:hypothetical protein
LCSTVTGGRGQTGPPPPPTKKTEPKADYSTTDEVEDMFRDLTEE